MTLAVAATAFMATTANAQTKEQFTDDLAISLNDAPQDPVDATVELEHKADGTSTFMLKNFTFGIFEVGDVIVEGIKGVKNGDATTYDFEGTAKLPSDKAVAEALGHQVPLKLHSVVEGGSSMLRFHSLLQWVKKRLRLTAYLARSRRQLSTV